MNLHEIYKEDLACVTNLMISSFHIDGVPLIEDLAGYILQLGGKRMRPLLVIAAAKICGYEGLHHHNLAASIELMHTATLLHDDVIDTSQKRRGEKCAHTIWGNKASVLVGDFLLSRSFQLVVHVGLMDVLHSFSSVAASIAQGEVQQLSASYDPNLSFEQYISIVSSKTAMLFSLACEIGSLLAGKEADIVQLFKQFGLYLGILFQMIDDILDYQAPRKTWGKKQGDDFREGKITLPFILAYKDAREDQKKLLRDLFADEKKEGDAFAQVLSIFHETNAFQRAQEHISYFSGQARNIVDRLSGPLSQACLLSEVVDFCMHRTH